MPSGRAVFLDRDGTLILDRDYLADPDGVALVPGAADAVRRLNRAGLPVVVVTNQSGIGRGYYDEAAYEAVQARLATLLAEAGAHLDAVYHCPHPPDRMPPCDCRKPAVGLFLRAAREHGMDLARSFFIGDRVRDVAAALRFGGTGILVPRDGDGPFDEAPPGVLRAASLARAADEVLGRAAD